MLDLGLLDEAVLADRRVGADVGVGQLRAGGNGPGAVSAFCQRDDWRAGFTFRARRLQVEYSSGFGYAINTFLSTRLPVFWKGETKVDRGIAVHYEQNVFHTRKIFALDVGTSGSEWRTRASQQGFFTLSVYPLIRFFLVRARTLDAYLCYSLAGPTYISTRRADGRDLGSRFTFQDFVGAGVLVGKARTVALGVKINHYSNGILVPENAGVMVPVTFTVGWTF